MVFRIFWFFVFALFFFELIVFFLFLFYFCFYFWGVCFIFGFLVLFLRFFMVSCVHMKISGFNTFFVFCGKTKWSLIPQQSGKDVDSALANSATCPRKFKKAKKNSHTSQQKESQVSVQCAANH
jgi:hypothetical protein